MNTIKKLFFISRPVSWPNTAYPFAAGYLVSGGTVDVLFVIATLYFLGPYNLLMYGVNDVFDYESDIRNPRKGGIEGMREQRTYHPTIIKAAILTNAPFLLVLFGLGTWVSNCVLLILLFFVIAYSMKHLRFKEIPILDSLTSSAHFVGPLFYALSLTHISTASWPYLGAFFLWGMASHAFGAVQDIIPDRTAKLSSIATFFGARWTVRLAAVCYASAAVIVLLQPLPFALIGISGLMYVLNISHLFFLADNDSARANRPWRRFIWLNLLTGFVVTMVLLIANVPFS